MKCLVKTRLFSEAGLPVRRMQEAAGVFRHIITKHDKIALR